MLFSIFRDPSYDFKTKITLAVFSIVIVVFSLTIHEVCHGATALALGDPTAKQRGRLTLNPLKHLNPMGAICMLLFGFGWAEPVPINPYYFKNRKLGMAITALAGPASNLIISFLSMIAMRGTDRVFGVVQNGENLFSLIYLFFYMLHMMNLYLAIFNLIPVPPLDGSRILFIFLPSDKYFKVMKYERYIALGLIALLYFGVLSGPLSFIVNGISSGMEWLVSLVL